MQAEPTPEKLAELWNNNSKENVISEKGYDYRIRIIDSYADKNGQRVFYGFDVSVLECYLDGNLLWKAERGDFYIYGAVHTSKGTVVWGHSYFTLSNTSLTSWLARFDDDGKHDLEKKSSTTVLLANLSPR
jgi:hypothetical protein